jgi:endonuclease G
MRKIIYPLVALIIVAGYVWYEAQTQADQQSLDPQEIPVSENKNEGESDQPWMTVVDYLPTSSDPVIHHHTYSLSYNEDHEQANWTAHVLKARDINSKDYKRPYFEIDNQVITGAAHWKNYKKSGYDRGHLVPAGDRKANLQSYTETFLTSNISPQKHDFNSGIWNDLEQQVRKYALEYGDLYVVTGPILKSNLKTIGAEKVSVPESFYKIVFQPDFNGGTMIAYVIPVNTRSNNLAEFLVAVDKVEELTGIDFFSQLENDKEVRLERVSGKGF